MKKITVLLAEDHTIVREGLRHMLELEADFEVIGEAADGRQAVALGVKLRPEVVLMDIAMPRLNGLEATQQLLKALPAVKVIMLSSLNDDARVVSAINSGVAGFLFKQISARFMCQTIREVYQGKTIFSPEIARRLGRLPAPLTDRAGKLKLPITQLTPRQREVLQLIVEGKANKQMAEELGLDIKTIDKHREGLMRKLDIHDTAGLTRYAIDAGIITSRVPLTVK